MILLAFYRQRRVLLNLLKNAECKYYKDKLNENKRTINISLTYAMVY